MNTNINSISENGGVAKKAAPAAKTESARSVSFEDILRSQHAQSAAGAAESPEGGRKIFVGQLNSRHRSVSELLMQHESLKESTWNIIYSEQNQDKDYTRIKPGTSVYYNPDDGTLSWQGSESSVNATHHGHEIKGPPQPAAAVAAERSASTVSLGVLSKETPTVSHLLKAHPDFTGQTWQLLSNPVNSGKPFDRIPAGAEIRIDRQSMEISWNPAVSSRPTTISLTASRPEQPEPLPGRAEAAAPAADLTEAVQPFLGKPYKEIDCYELVVKGLQRMDIPYKGKDGLHTRLTRMALEKGLPANAYLNGEGLVKAAGALVLSRNYSTQHNWRKGADALYREMEPLLDKGQILSFSTQSRGHTGIISQQQKQWTFINSGRLDNSLYDGSPSRGVGEEVLHEEIRNWFRLAHSRKEELSVTLGRVEQPKIAASAIMPDQLGKRI